MKLKYKLRKRVLTALLLLELFMSGKRGSNPRPSAWEADALPTELLPRYEAQS